MFCAGHCWVVLVFAAALCSHLCHGEGEDIEALRRERDMLKRVVDDHKSRLDDMSWSLEDCRADLKDMEGEERKFDETVMEAGDNLQVLFLYNQKLKGKMEVRNKRIDLLEKILNERGIDFPAETDQGEDFTEGCCTENFKLHQKGLALQDQVLALEPQVQQYEEAARKCTDELFEKKEELTQARNEVESLTTDLEKAREAEAQESGQDNTEDEECCTNLRTLTDAHDQYKADKEEELQACVDDLKQCDTMYKQSEGMQTMLKTVIDEQDKERNDNKKKLDKFKKAEAKYRRYFGFSFFIIFCILVIFGTQYGMKKWADYSERKRLEKKQLKLEKKDKKKHR